MCLAGQPLEYQSFSHWYDSTWKKDPRRKGESNPDQPISRRTILPLGQRGGLRKEGRPARQALGQMKTLTRALRRSTLTNSFICLQPRYLLACPDNMPVYLRDFFVVVGCLTSQHHASVSQGRICSDKFTCCHTKIEVYCHRANQSQH